MMILNLGLRLWGFEDLGGAEVAVVNPFLRSQGTFRCKGGGVVYVTPLDSPHRCT